MPQDYMCSKMDGKKVKSISWVEPYFGNREITKDEEAIFHYEYFGDHADSWIIFLKNGIEEIRYNIRFLDTITWL